MVQPYGVIVRQTEWIIFYYKQQHKRFSHEALRAAAEEKVTVFGAGATILHLLYHFAASTVWLKYRKCMQEERRGSGEMSHVVLAQGDWKNEYLRWSTVWDPPHAHTLT